MRWISGFLQAFRRVCHGGDEVDFWVFAAVPAGVPRRCRGRFLGFCGRSGGCAAGCFGRSLYAIYSTCLPAYNVVRPGASSHCGRRLFGAMRVPPVLSFCQRLYSVRTPCTRRAHAVVCASEWLRGPFRSLRVLRDRRGGLVHAPHVRHATIFFS
jgi:hypothetical protein